MPLILSDLLLRSSTITSINIERTIKQVATASIVGLNCSLKTRPPFELVLLCYLIQLRTVQSQLHRKK